MEGRAVDFYSEMIIPFSGLKPGQYQFDFDVEGSFFENFEYSEIIQAAVKVSCLLDRKPRMLVFDFNIDGTVTLPCDRCLEECVVPVSGKERYIVKFGPERLEESEEVLVISEQEHEIDLRQVIFEYIHLALPLKRVHGEDEFGRSLCNPEMIRFITDPGDEAKTDPRWDALKDLKGFETTEE